MRRVLATVSRACCAALIVTAVEAAPSEPPLGLWVWNAAPEKAAVQVSLERVDGEWRGTVDGEPVSVRSGDGKVFVEAPGGQGFVGDVTDGAATIVGHWTQPSSSSGFSAMVTPTTFFPSGDSRWAARVALQPRTFRVFLEVFEDEQDGLVAVVRNPERNEIMRATRFRVERSGNRSWVLVAGRGDRRIRQSLQEVADGLELAHSWFDSPLTLRRAAPRRATPSATSRATRRRALHGIRRRHSSTMAGRWLTPRTPDSTERCSTPWSPNWPPPIRAKGRALTACF